LQRRRARFLIRNNQYLYNRARGILLQSSCGLLENNTFIGQTGHGLILGVAPDSGGPGVQNVIVRGNHFANVGSIPQMKALPEPDAAYGAMMIAVQGDADNSNSRIPVHANLVLDSNTFNKLRGRGLFIARANDVVVVSRALKMRCRAASHRTFCVSAPCATAAADRRHAKLPP
jgi:hypothetical protein